MTHPRTRLLVALLALPALFWSCSTADSPAEPPLRPQAATSPQLDRIARYADGGPGLTIGLAWRWIGPAGGTLRLGDFEIVVPAGAVSEATRFSIRLDVAGQTKDRVLAEFEPHNRPFAVPVTVRLPYAGTSAEGLDSRVLWWDGSSWVPFATVVTPDGRLEAKTGHLSTWGTEEPERGYIFLGG